MKSRELEIRIRDQLGVKQQLVNKKEIHDLEPNLKPFYHGGVFYDYARHARNPRKILIKLFENFVNKGGKFLKLNIQNIDFDQIIKFIAMISPFSNIEKQVLLETKNLNDFYKKLQSILELEIVENNNNNKTIN